MPSQNLLEIVLRLRDEASSGLEKFSKKTKTIGEDISRIGKEMTITGGVITGAIGLIVNAAANAEKSWAKVSQEVKLAGLDIEKTIPKIKDFASGMQSLTGFSDELVGEFVGRMLPVTKDLGLAFEATKLAMDMSIGTGRDLETMQRAMTMVFSGNIEALRMLVPEIRGLDSEQLKTMNSAQKVAFAMEAIRKQFGGLAEQEGKTAAGQMKILKETVDDLWEDLGGILLPIVQKVVANIRAKIEAIRTWISNNKELTETIMKIVAGLGIFLTGIGGSLLIIGKFIQSISGAVSVLKMLGSAFSFAFGNPIVLLITGIIAVIGLFIYKLNELGKVVGGMKNAWYLTLIFMKEKVIEWGISVLETFDKVAKYVPGLNWSVGKGLDYLRDKLSETKKDFDALANAQKENKEKADDLTMTIPNLSKVEAELGKVNQDTEETFKNQIETIKDLRSEIKDLYKQLADNVEDYQKKETEIREDYQQRMVEVVAEAENDVLDLKQRALEEANQGNIKEANDLYAQIAKKEDMIKRFHENYKNLEDDLAEYKRYLAMDELGRLEFDMQKKIMLAQKEFLEKQVVLLQELILKTQMHNEAIKMIGEEKMEAINAEIEKTKTFKEKLQEKIEGLKDWVSESIKMYRNYVDSVNLILSQIRTPIPFGGFGGVKGGYQFGTAYVPETGPYLLHKGEAVIPANRNFVGGISVNIYGGTYLSEEAAEEMGDLIIKKLKRNLRI